MSRYLVIVEDGYRGGPEVQYADPLYIIRGLHRQFGTVDVALRGTAVTYALQTGPGRPPLAVGSRVVDTMPDHPRSLRALLDAGAAVFVDADDLRRHGILPDRLTAGVTCRDAATLTRAWPRYQGVWFL